MNKPLFIVFEGVDLSGKSTHAKLLVDWFESIGESALLTAQPSTSNDYGLHLRESLFQ